jgi:hypothetical protein
MRNVIAWVLIIVGLILGVGGAGMIVIGLLSQATGVSAAGLGWAVVGGILTFPGFRLRTVSAKPYRDRR